MAIQDFVKEFLSSESDGSAFKVVFDSYGISFGLNTADYKACEKFDAENSVQQRFVHLQTFVEQGIAEALPNGFSISTENWFGLNDEDRLVLAAMFDLPDGFLGSYKIQVSGHSKSRDFSVQCLLQLPGGDEVCSYRLRGVKLIVSDYEEYLLSWPEYNALSAIELHHEDQGDNSEHANLKLIARLQAAKARGMRIDLSHFDDIRVIEPDSVSVTVIENEDGSLDLVPNYGDGSDPEQLLKSIPELTENIEISSIPVGNNKIVLTEDILRATREIQSNRKISKDQAKEFLKCPSAFINAELVDLDVGFSMRVLGAAEFKPAYFGETDEGRVDWFVKEKVEESYAPYEENNPELDDGVGRDGAVLDQKDELIEWEEKPESRSIAIDIGKNDESVDFSDENAVEKLTYPKDKIKWDRFKFTPYEYQKDGISWVLGLSVPTIGMEPRYLGAVGALLADDMGLGKTFMSLAALAEYLRISKEKGEKERPALIVAPLSLLDVWQAEVTKVFAEEDSPFRDIVVLQGERDLPRFKITGARKETLQDIEREPSVSDGKELLGIRYALKVGSGHGSERLDVYNRLVITTYNTLRDYQFSLSKVDWSYVVFDEAQQIKNPNTLAAIAAKALKAHFKLVTTGTPVENSLLDFWNLMDVARPGYLGPYQEFRKTYIHPINKATADERAKVRGEIGLQLRNKVGALMLRRTKDDELQGLPDKRVYTGLESAAGESGAQYMKLLACTMPKIQQQAYEDVVSSVNAGLGKENSAGVVLQGLHNLRAVSLHPELVGGGKLELPGSKSEAEKIIRQSGKLTQTFKLLEQIKERKEKAIIFAVSKKLQEFLKVACKRVFSIDVSIINGETKAVSKRENAELRTNLIERFEEASGFGVIIMSPIAAGMGLTVVGANNVIHLERHWNPAKEAQATDRVYRIGQKKDVNIYYPILLHPNPDVVTFDMNLERLLTSKCALKDAVITPEEVGPEEAAAGIFSDEIINNNESVPINFKTLHKLGWERFEALCAELLSREYDLKAFLTKRGADGKADVLLRGSKNILVQVKHKENPGRIMKEENPVAEIYAAEPAYQNSLGAEISELCVFSNVKSFSRRTKEAAKLRNVTLIGNSEIKKLMKKHMVTNLDLLKRLNAERYSL